MNYLEIIGTLIGLVYLWLEYRASIYLWIAGIVMPAIYIFVYYKAGLYADFGINIYYLLAAAYGWAMWTRKQKHSAAEPARAASTAASTAITKLPLKYVPALTAVFAVAFVGIAWVLIRFTDSTVPWLDSFTTALSIIAMWMLARKYVEQWWAWILVNVVCCGLYIYKDLYFTSVLYGLYAIIAIFGYYKWKRMMESAA